MKPFLMYEGADPANKARVMPSADMVPQTAPRSIFELCRRLEAHTADPEGYEAQYPWAERFVMGYPLPSWQRPSVWTEEQDVKFVTSLWKGVDPGSYLVQDLVEYEGNTIVTLEFSECLLDGQQRLTALQGYLQNEFAVPDAQGNDKHWSDLGLVERRTFCNRIFPRAVVQSLDEDTLREIYDLRAFGGTAHEASQRASARP